MANDDLIFGWHAVSAALKYEPDSLLEIIVEPGHRNRALALLGKTGRAGFPIREEPRAILDKLIGDRRHQGIVAKRAAPPPVLREDALDRIFAAAGAVPLVVALDEIQDPHNLGACLRSADAAGVTAVISPAHRAARLNATVRKVACGAAETVPFVQVVNLARALRALRDERGFRLVGAASDATISLYEVDFTEPTIIALGGEEKGLRRLTRETCDVLARIPMAGKVESLNVSVAAGIFLFEAVRQRESAARLR